MSRPTSSYPSSRPTPAPSSPPPPSESFLSDIDGTAPSLLGTDYGFQTPVVDTATLNLVSWKLDVNARAEDGVDKRGFNAISTVLNHPTKRADPLRASRKPLPPLSQPPPTLSKPPPASTYDTYLESLSHYDAFINAQNSAPDDPILNGSAPSTSKANLPPLTSVPDLFFDPAFDLANPSTWSALVEAEGEGELAQPEGKVQDELSSHLDTLEAHLVHEITLRSSAFFSALSNLQDLHSESSSILSHIGELKSSLKDVSATQARKGLEIIDAQEKLRVLRATEGGLRTVGELDDLVKFAKSLVEAGDWSGALGCLGDVARWWQRHSADIQREPGPTENESTQLPLSTLPALTWLPISVTQLASSIATQLESAITSLLASVLAKADGNAPLDKDELRGSLQPMLHGLAQCGKLDGVEEAWRDVLMASVREGSRKHLPVNSEEDGLDEKAPEARGATLADALKGLDHSAFLLLLAQMFSSLMSRLTLAQSVGEVMQEIVGEIGTVQPITVTSYIPDSSGTPPRAVEADIDLAGVLASGCELANARASKVLAVRAEQNSQLPLEDFVELFKENWDFVVATETMAKRMIVSLRGTTASQARAFLVTYHSVRLTKSANLVQEEQWTQIDVDSKTQHAVNLLTEAAVSDPPECLVPAQVSNGESTSGASTKTLSVEDKTFFVVKATGESLVLLEEYLKIVINLELVTTDVMSRIIEFLKSFNSRTCQVVLGAGAMRSAGLKNITAKHLALASQSLSVVVALIPYIREFIRRHLSAKQAVMLTEFDKLKRDYQEHQNEIHAKLVAIMSDRLAVHIGALREIDWEAVPAKESANPYAEMLVKETATLHKVLSKYLAPQTVDIVLSEVLAAIVTRLSEEYGRIDLKSDDGKKRMARDAALINTRLAPLAESGSTLQSLEAVVRDKPTPRRAVGLAMRNMMNRVNSTPTKGGTSEPSTPVNESVTPVQEDAPPPPSEVEAKEAISPPADVEAKEVVADKEVVEGKKVDDEEVKVADGTKPAETTEGGELEKPEDAESRPEVSELLAQEVSPDKEETVPAVDQVEKAKPVKAEDKAEDQSDSPPAIPAKEDAKEEAPAVVEKETGAQEIADTSTETASAGSAPATNASATAEPSSTAEPVVEPKVESTPEEAPAVPSKEESQPAETSEAEASEAAKETPDVLAKDKDE